MIYDTNRGVQGVRFLGQGFRCFQALHREHGVVVQVRHLTTGLDGNRLAVVYITNGTMLDKYCGFLFCPVSTTSITATNFR